MEDFEKQSKPERRNFVRFPIKLFVDRIEFEPDVYAADTIRTAYDLDLTKEDAKRLYEELKKRLEKHPMTDIRIRVIGRLSS